MDISSATSAVTAMDNKVDSGFDNTGQVGACFGRKAVRIECGQKAPNDGMAKEEEYWRQLSDLFVDSTVNKHLVKKEIELSGNISLVPEFEFPEDLQKILDWFNSAAFIECLSKKEHRVNLVKKTTKTINRLVADSDFESLFKLSANLGNKFSSANTLALCSEEALFSFARFAKYPSTESAVKFSEALIKDLDNIFNQCKEGCTYQQQSQASTREIQRQKLPCWMENSEDLNPDDLIKISHGGGYFFIERFLQGNHPGYNLEIQCGLGIHVSPYLHPDCKKTIIAKAKKYMINAPAYLDRPARLEAEIPVKYLIRVKNAYEAAINTECLKYLQNVRIVLA